MKFYNNATFDNIAFKQKFSGVATLLAGETIVLNTSGRKIGLQIIASSNSYKITDTVLDDSTIIAQDVTATEGWNTVDEDTWKTIDDSVQWDGITNAVRIQAKSDNTSSIKVVWRIR